MTLAGVMERMAEEIVAQFGYLGLVVVSFVAATLVPVSSAVVVVWRPSYY